MTLAEIRRLIYEATPGPWGYCYDGSSTWSVGSAADPQSPQVASLWRGGAAECPDARFIAAARTLLPALLEVAEKANLLLEVRRGWEMPEASGEGDDIPRQQLLAALAALDPL